MTQHFHGGHGPTAEHPDPFPAVQLTKYKPPRKRPLVRSRSQPDVATQRRRTGSSSDNRDVIADISDVLQEQQSAQHGLDILAQVCTSELELHGIQETTSKDDHTYCGTEEVQPVPTQTFHKPLTQHALSTNRQCFYYTGVPTVILFHFLFNWIMPFAAKFTLRCGDDKFSYQSVSTFWSSPCFAESHG